MIAAKISQSKPLIMPTKKVVHNTDAKQVASKQQHELKYICSVFTTKNAVNSALVHLSPKDLKNVMSNLGTKAQPCRSRRKIYIALKGMGYTYTPKK
jgi:hypothetical protein